jgi:hypothetical protein
MNLINSLSANFDLLGPVTQPVYTERDARNESWIYLTDVNTRGNPTQLEEMDPQQLCEFSNRKQPRSFPQAQ